MDYQDVLIGEQLKHMVDVIDAKLDRIELNQVQLNEMTPDKRGQVTYQLNYLEKQAEDHEARIRAATEGVTQFKIKSELTSEGSGILSILAILRSF